MKRSLTALAGLVLITVLIPAGDTCAAEVPVTSPKPGVEAGTPRFVDQVVNLPPGIPHGGLVVAVGIGDAVLLQQLTESRTRPVHALVANMTAVDRLRGELRAAGILGLVQVEAWSGPVLPYANRLARVVIHAPGVADDKELDRVTAPGGVRLLLQSGKLTLTQPSTVEGMDEWPQPFHDAGRSRLSNDRLCGLPQTFQWQSGPLYRNSAVVIGSGSVVSYEMLNDVTIVVVRDAASGVLRWRKQVVLAGANDPGVWRDCLGHTFGLGGKRVNESATIVGQRLFVTTTPHPLVYNLDDGALIGELATAGPVRCLPTQTGLVLAASSDRLEAFSTATLAPVWSVPWINDTNKRPPGSWNNVAWYVPDLANELTVTPGGLVVFTDTSKTPFDLVALKLADGKQAWRVGVAPYWNDRTDPDPQKPLKPQALTVMATGDLIILLGSRNRGEMIALDANTGKERWRAPHIPFKNAGGVELEGEIASNTSIAMGGGLLWYTATTKGNPSRIALDPADGSRLGYLQYDDIHCQWSFGSSRWVCFKDANWIDAEKLRRTVRTKDGMVRDYGQLLTGTKWRGFFTGWSTCGWQTLLAYGLSFQSPKECPCVFDGASLRASVDSDQIPATQKNDGKIGLVETGPGTPGKIATGWCQYGADSRRSFASPTPLPKELVERWRKPVTLAPESEWTTWNCDHSRISQSVVAGDQVWVTDLEGGEAICLSLTDGRERFRCNAGARIDGPPSLIGGLVVAGGHDGWLYAWSSSDGRLVRRTRLAAGERRIVIQGRVESSWPVAGPVLVDNGLAFAQVGRYRRMLEQVQTCAVDLTDGKMTPNKGGPGGSVGIRNNFVTRGYRGGGGGGAEPVCANNGTFVASFDIRGREVQLQSCGDMGNKKKAATWNVAMPAGEVAAAVVIAGDAVVCATYRWSNDRYGLARYIPTPAFGPDPGAPTPGHLLVLSLADGGERQRMELPMVVVHQGLAVHDGKLVVCGRDGLVLAYGTR